MTEQKERKPGSRYGYKLTLEGLEALEIFLASGESRSEEKLGEISGTSTDTVRRIRQKRAKNKPIPTVSETVLRDFCRILGFELKPEYIIGGASFSANIEKSIVSESEARKDVTSSYQEVDDWFHAIGWKCTNLDISRNIKSVYLYKDITGKNHIIHLQYLHLTKKLILDLIDIKTTLDAIDIIIITSGNLTYREEKYIEMFIDVYICTFDALISDFLHNISTQFDKFNTSDTSYGVNLSLPLPFLDFEGDTHTNLVDYLEGCLDGAAAGPPAHFAIIGEYGAGKSQAMRDYAKRQIHRYFQEKDSKGNPIPIYLDAANAEKFTSPLDMLDQYARRELGCADARPIQTLLTHGRAILLVDGLDEIFYGYKPEDVIGTLRDFISICGTGRSRVVLSARREWFPDELSYHNLFESLGYRPFTGSEKIPLVQPIRFEVLKILPLEIDDVRKAIPADINQKVKLPNNIIEICRRPVILQMLSSVASEIVTLSTPSEVDIFFLAIRNELRSESMIRFGSFHKCLELFHQLAWEFLTHGGVAIDRSTSPIFSSRPTGKVEKVDAVPHSGLLGWNAGGGILPAHRSVAEFLVALRLASALNVLDPRFDELVPTPPSETREFLTTGLVPLQLTPAIRRFLMHCQGSASESKLWNLISEQQYSQHWTWLSGVACTLLRDIEATFVGRDLSGLLLDHADFSGCDLNKACFQRSSLRRCNFANTNLSGVDFTDADISSSSWSEHGSIYSMSVSVLSGQVAVAVQGVGIEVYPSHNLQSTHLLHERRGFHNRTVYDVKFSPDASRIAWFASPSEVGIWTLGENRVVMDNLSRAGWNGCLCWLDSSKIAIASGKDIRLFKISKKGGLSPSFVATHTVNIKMLARGWNSDELFVVDEVGMLLRYKISESSLHVVASPRPHIESIRGLVVDPVLGYVVTGSKDGFIRIFDRSLCQLNELKIDGGVFAVAVGYNGTVAASYHPYKIVVWFPSDQRVIHLLTPAENARSLAFVDGGNRLLAAGYDGSVSEWRTGEVAMQTMFTFTKQRLHCNGLRLCRTVGVTTEHRQFFTARGAILT